MADSTVAKTLVVTSDVGHGVSISAGLTHTYSMNPYIPFYIPSYIPLSTSLPHTSLCRFHTGRRAATARPGHHQYRYHTCERDGATTEQKCTRHSTCQPASRPVVRDSQWCLLYRDRTPVHLSSYDEHTRRDYDHSKCHEEHGDQWCVLLRSPIQNGCPV